MQCVLGSSEVVCKLPSENSPPKCESRPTSVEAAVEFVVEFYVEVCVELEKVKWFFFLQITKMQLLHEQFSF